MQRASPLPIAVRWTVPGNRAGVHFHSTVGIQPTNPMPAAAWGPGGQDPRGIPMHTRLLFATLALGLFGLATVPNAVAADPGLDASVSLLQCWTTSFDAQHDGNAETWSECSTPTCGCNCPYVGAGVVVEAAPIDRQVGVAAVTSGWQTDRQ